MSCYIQVSFIIILLQIVNYVPINYTLFKSYNLTLQIWEHPNSIEFLKSNFVLSNIK